MQGDCLQRLNSGVEVMMGGDDKRRRRRRNAASDLIWRKRMLWLLNRCIYCLPLVLLQYHESFLSRLHIFGFSDFAPSPRLRAYQRAVITFRTPSTPMNQSSNTITCRLCWDGVLHDLLLCNGVATHIKDNPPTHDRSSKGQPITQ